MVPGRRRHIVSQLETGRSWWERCFDPCPEAAVALSWNPDHDWDLEQWRRQAACRDIDRELFFPVGTTGRAVRQIEIAKSVCSGCGVAYRCLEYAVSTNQEAGVWGGVDEEQRRALRKDPDPTAAVSTR